MAPYPLRLYRFRFSTNGERVALALAHKGIAALFRFLRYALLWEEGDPDRFHKVLRDTLAPNGRFPRLGAWIRWVEALPRA